MLDPDGEANKFGFDAAGELLLGSELGMSRGCRVDSKRFGVTKVGNVGEYLERVDELGAGFGSAFDSEDDDTTTFTPEIFLVLLEFRIVGKSREADPFDTWMGLQMLGDGE